MNKKARRRALDGLVKDFNEKLNDMPRGTYDAGLGHAVLICVSYVEGSPLLMEDNELGFCERCTEPIQFRPMNQGAVHKQCVSCALITLKEHNANA